MIVYLVMHGTKNPRGDKGLREVVRIPSTVHVLHHARWLVDRFGASACSVWSLEHGHFWWWGRSA